MKTAVNRTTEPGVAVGTSELTVILSWDTVTVAEQRGSVLPAGQSLPGEVEVRVLARIMLPGSGFFTVTE